MPFGTRVRTTYQHSETGKIVRPRAESLPLPSPDWFVIRFDRDGKRACIHRSMFAVRND